jgi:hypothetical protein
MVDMKSEERNQPESLSEEQIDAIVIVQADDDTAWEEPISVRRTEMTSISLPPEIAARAAFFARLHHASDVGEWLRDIIQERLNLEEAAFTEIKRELAAKNRV